MRNLILLFVLIVGLAACGGDDNCTSETIVGTYMGINNCDDTSGTGVDLGDGDVTLEIVALGNNNYSATNQDGDETVFTVDGCTITVPDLEFEFFGIMIATSGDGNFDGDQLTLNINTVVDGAEFTCNYTGTKQL